MSEDAPCRFALSCLGAAGYEPPPQQRQPTGEAVCRVCGGPTHGRGWRADALSANFADRDLLAAPDAQAICQPCLYFAVGETWQAHAGAHSELGIKVWSQASWRSYSHFLAPGRVEHPGPARWGELLDAPPSPPWLAIISTTAKRNLLFRGQVTRGVSHRAVLLETDLIWMTPEDWRGVRAAFEALMAEARWDPEHADRVEFFDGVLDVLVVAIGTGVSAGLPLSAGWREVLRTNLAKIDPETGMVRRRADGKVVKPDGWAPPELRRILAEHDGGEAP